MAISKKRILAFINFRKSTQNSRNVRNFLVMKLSDPELAITLDIILYVATVFRSNKPVINLTIFGSVCRGGSVMFQGYTGPFARFARLSDLLEH